MSEEFNTTKLVQHQRDYFNTDATKSVDFRINQLKKMKSLIRQYEDQILGALTLDLGRHPMEGYVSEIMLIINEINFCLKKLKSWTKPKIVENNFFISPAKSKIYYEPFGVSLIISPWNYPFLLSMRPLLGAICAGNCATLKVSEQAPFTSKVILELINRHFPQEYLCALDCGPKETEKLIQSGYDFILYSGETQAGKNIMKMAADTLAPVVLTLAGKSPVIVDETADINHAAKRIVWGKYINSGQTCLAPAYVYVHVSRKDELINAIQQQITKSYGEDPINNSDYGKIINNHHFKKLTAFLSQTEIVFGGRMDEEKLKIEPTIIEVESLHDNIMQEEIFGPILPILTYKDLDILISQLKKLPKPFSLYHFSKHKASINKVNQTLSFGGGCVNDCVIHSTNKYFPFGGVGSSGFGSYVGEQGFKTFSHTKSIIERRKIMIADLLPIMPAYTEKKFKLFRMFAKIIGY
ncbi:MAG: hypothetical protein BGO43_06270 [Gammaproteobacteria bacterium 39-13]|nr:MAG: hypothetical protein BGO43_06270 [Gammaproteobacteria bacterium 39-13]